MFQCCIFDLDGTLINSLEDLADACNWVLRENGLPTHPVDAYRRFVGDGAYKLAERMLQAVRDTAENWIRSDGDLHYARLPDGSYGRDDYPYLTYNDLYLLQTYLEGKGRAVPELQRLMDAKRAWMDANGITGYLT